MHGVEVCRGPGTGLQRAQSALRAVGRSVRLVAGEVLHRQGAESGGLVLVEDGLVRLSIAVGDGQDLTIASIGPGGLVGVVSAVDGGTQPSTATVERGGRAVVVPRPHLRSLLDDDPSVAGLLLRRLTDTCRQADQRLVQQFSKTTLARVVDCLETMHERADGDRITTTQRELADWVGATRESTARSLGHLRKAGVIETGRGWILVLDRERLAEATS